MFYGTPPIVTNGLVLNLDAANRLSYPTSGTTWTDLSGFGNNGTLTNGPTYNPNNSGSIVFDGTNDCVVTPKVSFSFSGGGTVGMWVKLNKIDVQQAFFGGNGYHESPQINPSFINFWMDTNNKIRWEVINIYPGSYTAIFSTTSFSLNTWYYVTGVFNQTNIFLYVNGVLESSVLQSNQPTSFNSTINLGRYANTTPAYFGNCQISNFQFYKIPLTSVEILQNYNAYKSRFGLT